MDMAARQTDYLLELVKTIARSVERLEEKQDDQTDLITAVKTQAEKTNGRVTRIENDMYNTPKAKDLPPWYRDPKYVQIFLYLAIAFVLLVGAATQVDVRELLP